MSIILKIITLNRQFVTVGGEVQWCDPLGENEWWPLHFV